MARAPSVAYSTGCSRVVTHPGTNSAPSCLTLVNWRETGCRRCSAVDRLGICSASRVISSISSQQPTPERKREREGGGGGRGGEEECCQVNNGTIAPARLTLHVAILTNMSRFCRTWTNRYLITSQMGVKRVSRIHHRTILVYPANAFDSRLRGD